jgi:hypothetical protein
MGESSLMGVRALNSGVGGSSPSQPTYVGKSEFYVQTLDVDQNLK